MKTNLLMATRSVSEGQLRHNPSLMRWVLILAITLVVTLVASPTAHASVGGEIIKALGRYLAKETGQEATELAVKQMTKQVGEELIERTAQKVVREGGEKSLAQVGAMVAKHGPDVVRALDNAPDALPLLKLLDELPADEIGKAASRLAAGSTGKELAVLGTKVGTVALRAEAKHPGVGVRFARALGSDGAELSMKLTTDQAVQIGRHVDDIAQLPATQQSQLLTMISSNADRFAAFVGRFVEKNPGKVLFTAAGTTLVLAESERMLGGDEIVFNKDGEPKIVSKPGLVGRTSDKAMEIGKEPLQWSIYAIGGVAAVSLALLVGAFGGLKFWKHLSMDKLAVSAARNSEVGEPIATRSVSEGTVKDAIIPRSLAGGGTRKIEQ